MEKLYEFVDLTKKTADNWRCLKCGYYYPKPIPNDEQLCYGCYMAAHSLTWRDLHPKKL